MKIRLYFLVYVNDKNLERKFQEHHTRTVESGEFWKDSPYLVLMMGLHYANEQVFLQLHSIIDQGEKAWILPSGPDGLELFLQPDGSFRITFQVCKINTVLPPK